VGNGNRDPSYSQRLLGLSTEFFSSGPLDGSLMSPWSPSEAASIHSVSPSEDVPIFEIQRTQTHIQFITLRFAVIAILLLFCHAGQQTSNPSH